jgi:hypothetical protein
VKLSEWIDEGEALAAMATKGPWHLCEYPEDAGVSCVESEEGIIVNEATDDMGQPHEGNADFIAAARERLPAAMAMLRVATEALDHMAAWGDEGGNKKLREQLSFGRFDEPCAVEESRDALAAMERIAGGTT